MLAGIDPILQISGKPKKNWKMEDITVINNEAKQRFEYEKNGLVATIEFKIMGDKIILLSTNVPQEMSGQGIGSRLVKQSFELIKNMNLKVVPVCSFIQGWLRKNNVDKELLA